MGAAFLSKLRIEDTERERHGTERAEWVLLEPFGYRSSKGWEVWVPAGYVTDFSSIPARLQDVESSTGRARRAAVIHDWLYSSRIVPREAADKTFLDAMECCGVPYLKRSLMFRAVRTFGGSGYGRPEEYEAAKALLERSDLPLAWDW
jgi:hypothetical protein